MSKRPEVEERLAETARQWVKPENIGRRSALMARAYGIGGIGFVIIG